MAQNDPVVFKILSGVQSGVEVTLADGDYALGSGPADDIQLIDVSLLPGHARLRLVGTAIEIAAGEGRLRTSSGATLEPKGPFQALAPLDVVTAGTTRFALGPNSANWASVNEEDGATARAPRTEAVEAGPAARDRLRVLALPLLALALLLGIAGWFVFGTGLRSTFRGHDGSADAAMVRTALDAFPFGQPIAVRQEVDGAIYVEGFVDTPVERRALAGALEKTGVQAHVRLWVLQSMRADIKALIGAEKVDVSFDLSPKGQLALSGVILDKSRAEGLVSQIRDRVFGIAGIESSVRTGDNLLADVRKLVSASGLQPWLILRLDRDLIEVDGALPSDKVDAWVGFLQSYSDKFAKLIALRSFVQLQGENGRLTPAPTSALVLGTARPAAGDSTVNVAKLRSGSFDLSDVLVGSGPLAEKGTSGAGDGRSAAAADAATGPTNGRAAAAADAAAGPGARGGAAGVSSALDRSASAGSGPGGAGDRGAAAPAAAAAGAATGDAALAKRSAAQDAITSGSALPERASTQEAGQALGDRAAALLRRFKDGTLSADPSAADLYHSLLLLGGDALSSAGGGTALPDWYLPLLSGPSRPGSGRPCWPGSQLDDAGILPALFWLDVLSTSRSLSVASLPRGQELLILEAGLDPAGIAACARRSPEAARAADRSLYLREVRRNSGFVRFIVRDVSAFSIDVAGVSLGTDRFILTQAGDRLFEGAAPDRGSRLALIGELGLVVQVPAGLSAVVFGPGIDWQVSN